MATVIYDNAYFLINAVDLSDHVKSLTLTYEAEGQDDTTMGDNTKSMKGGMKGWSISVEMVQDYAAAKVDVSLFALVGTTIAIEIRPDAGVIGATNPKYSGNALVQSYVPQSGEVGALLPATIELVASKGTGNADLTRATS